MCDRSGWFQSKDEPDPSSATAFAIIDKLPKNTGKDAHYATVKLFPHVLKSYNCREVDIDEEDFKGMLHRQEQSKEVKTIVTILHTITHLMYVHP